jgi:hypothetical protein
MSSLVLGLAFSKAEIVRAHQTCLSSKNKKEIELICEWKEALKHERDNRDRKLAIQAAAHVGDVQKAERVIGREWKKITAALQKQVGLEQSRAANIQLAWHRAEKTFNESVIQVELKLAKQNTLRLKEQDEFKVGLFISYFMICFLCHGCVLCTRPCQLWSTSCNCRPRKQIINYESFVKNCNGRLCLHRLLFSI